MECIKRNCKTSVNGKKNSIYWGEIGVTYVLNNIFELYDGYANQSILARKEIVIFNTDMQFEEVQLLFAANHTVEKKHCNK